MSAILSHEARRLPPGPAGHTSVGTSSTSLLSSIALWEGRYVMFQAHGDAGERIHLRFGDDSLSEATTNDIYITVGEREVFFMEKGHTHLRAIASAADCSLHMAVVGL